jgi:hypothetical protein
VLSRDADGEVVAATELGVIGWRSRCRSGDISGQMYGRDDARRGM